MNIFRKEIDTSVYSTGIIALILFFIYMSISAIFIFIQFSSFEILSVSIIFLGLFIGLVKFFLGDMFKEKLVFNISNTFVAFIAFIILFLFSNTIIGYAMKPGYYYPFFPLLDVELFINWDRDSAFHCSLIQSIINFGYPSIALHGTPLTVYHVLSHYVDALIIDITGLEVFDSYGLLFYFKVYIFISSIIIFILYITKQKNIFIFLFSLIIFSSIIIGTNGVGVDSHGLWFTSILVILSFYKVFTIAMKDDYTLKNFLFIVIFIIIIGLGKISTGFMYATFVGSILLLRFPKKLYIYITGILWILFFYLFQKFMIVNHSEFNISINILKKSYLYLKNPSDLLISIYTLISIIFIQIIVFSTEKDYKLIFSTLISLVILSMVIVLNPHMSPADILYFEYAYNSILILVLMYNLINFPTNKYTIILLLLIVALKFIVIPEKIPLNTSSYYSDIRYKNKLNGNRSLFNFRKNLKSFMKNNALNKTNTLLYIPKEIYQNDLSKFKGRGRTGFLIYALTGVPLIYGVNALENDYGYSDYNNDTLWLSKKDFNKTIACQKSKGKSIVMANSIVDDFTKIRCGVR